MIPAPTEKPVDTGDTTTEQRNHNPKVPGSSPGSGIIEKPALPGLSLFPVPPPVHDSRVPESPSESGNDPRVDPKASESEVRDAIFSEDRVYRYVLWRIWDKSRLPAVFIGLNPSTADETVDDPTIRRCVNYARDWGCGGIRMLNIFAFRATNPKVMRAAKSPVGPDNDRTLKIYSAGAELVVACLGIARGSSRAGRTSATPAQAARVARVRLDPGRPAEASALPPEDPAAHEVDMTAGLEEVLSVLRGARFIWTTEADLQDGIAAALDAHGLPMEREVRVDAHNRLDLLVRRVAIEVKIAGTWRDVRRQLERYAKQLDGVDALVLATTRPSHVRIGSELAGKPLVVHRIGSSL